MKNTRWVKFLGIIGFVTLVVGVAAFTLFDTDVMPFLTYGHIVFGIVSITLWFLFEGTKSLGQKGGAVSGRSFRFSSGVLLYTALFTSLLVMVNWLSNKYNRRYDLTEANVYSLAPQSKQIIEKLKEPLKLVAFDSSGSELGEMGDLLGLYKDANKSMVSYDVVDPRTSPALIEKYQIKPGNLLYLEYGKGENKGVSRIDEVNEQSLTNAIIKLTGGVAKKIYLIAGHGEPSLEEQSALGVKRLGEFIQDEHLKIETLLLPTAKLIPEDAAALVLVSPTKNLLQSETDMLSKYVEDGGSLLVLADAKNIDPVASLTQKFGIKLNNDVVVDTVQRLFAGPALGLEPIANSYGVHPITKNLRSGQDITLFNLASSVDISEQDKIKDAEYVELVKTGPNSWGETNLSAVFEVDPPTVALEDTDKKGPVTLAVSYQKKVSDSGKTSKMLVFGDSDWLRNGTIGGNFFNKDLALNSLGWLSGQEDTLSIRPRAIRASQTEMTPNDVKAILMSSFILPELILLAGLFVWWKRKELPAAA